MTKYVETHIGELLKEEFLKPYDLSQNALAIALHVPSTTINKIVNGNAKISIDMDLRLSKFFGLSEGFFLRAQESLERMNIRKKIEQDLNSIIPYSKKYA
jgi:addiction module HigA family antidote